MYISLVLILPAEILWLSFLSFRARRLSPPEITGALDSVHWHWLSLRPAVADILIFMF